MKSREETELFVDASGWLAYLDPEDLNHQKALDAIDKAKGLLLTTDKELLSLSHIAHGQIDGNLLAMLIWELWDNHIGKVIRITQEEELEAWNKFKLEDESTLSECTSWLILKKYKFQNLLSFSKWLKNNTSQLRLV